MQDEMELKMNLGVEIVLLPAENHLAWLLDELRQCRPLVRIVEEYVGIYNGVLRPGALLVLHILNIACIVVDRDRDHVGLMFLSYVFARRLFALFV